MNLNAKELEKVREVVKYLKVAVNSKSTIAYRFMTSTKRLEREVLKTIKKIKQTSEIKRVREYLELIDEEKGERGWNWYRFMTNKENLTREVITPLEKLVWTPQDEEFIERKVVPEFREKVAGKTLDEESKKAAEYGTKKKISRLWKIAAAVAAGAAVAYGIKRTVRFVKHKNAKK